MSFNPKTGGPAGVPTTRADWRRHARSIAEQNEAQRAKIARGEAPDYDPSQPLPRHSYREYP
jgi:hypothetical protein